MSFKSVEWGCNESFRECIQYVLYTCNIYVRYSVILENIGLLNPTGWCFSCLVDMSSYFKNLFCASSLLFLSVVFVVTKCQSPFRWCGRIQKLNCSHAAPISTIFLLVRSCLWLFVGSCNWGGENSQTASRHTTYHNVSGQCDVIKVNQHWASCCIYIYTITSHSFSTPGHFCYIP